MINDIRKVAIITLHGYNNYGNRLQNYALQETLRNLGFQVDTIIFKSQENTDRSLSRKAKILFKTHPKKTIRIIVDRIRNNHFYKKNKKLIENRIKAFKDFSKEYLNEIFIEDIDDNSSFIQKYKYFITGSDQVWNPCYINDMDKYFLTFAEKEQRISYAASFSCPDIPEQYKQKYRDWIKGMSKISVREKAGADIIKSLTGIEVPVLLDPTLLLSKEKWFSISKKATNKPEKDYILTYFLGKIDKKTKRYIENIAKQKKMEIVRLADIKDYESYVAGPGEFIDYINSASLVLTDSFHGVIFSILMRTPFIVFRRIHRGPSMYSRIETLLDMFHLRSREVQNIKDNEEMFYLDFSHIEPILKSEREKAINYLKEALSIEEEVRNEN